MIFWLFLWMWYPRFLFFLLCLYEFFLLQQRRKKKRQTYLAASRQSKEAAKPLLVLGRHPCEDSPEIEKGENEIHVEASQVEKYLAENDLDDYIIFESGVFTKNTDFKMVEECLRVKPPREIFLCHIQPYSFCAWLPDLTDGIIPKRIFIFYPPAQPFIYPVEHPVTHFRRSLASKRSLVS